VPAFNFIMPNADVTISANFTPKSYQVTTQSVPSAGGNTTGAGIYSFGQNVTVNAIPSTGYQFLNWTKKWRNSICYSFLFISNA
jgi:murein endopeptidase